ncbi:MAG TPA: response regulator [Cytophagaceae bacterium]|jgi:CitB family two-component system response regulator MalR|nr:response regulator [Cytophagaceae bacterium]
MKLNKIFLLDDDPIVNVINEQLFRKYNASKQYIICRTSQEALGYIDKANPLPEIVIIDLNIPLMNGFDFLEKCFDKFINQVSVYILTSSVNPEDYNKAMSYPFVKGYLKKPLTRDIVQKIIEEN